MTHEVFGAAARAAHGNAGGTRALVEVLLLRRHMADADVVAGFAAAVEARKAADLRAGRSALGRSRQDRHGHYPSWSRRRVR